MSDTQLRTRSGAVVGAAAVEAFAADVAGRLIWPVDPGYDAARRIWNALIDRRPGLVLRCAGVADVARAVRFARENDVLVAVRGGGHNVGGRAVCDAGLVIDLGEMRAVFVDPAARTARAQGGATLGDVDRETHLHGLAVPLGVVSKTGIGGLTLGGGVGWLVRRYGATCDNVLAFEVVTAEGAVLTASAEANPDLFWALRGGGGNFGIVTSFLYQAHPVATVLGGMIAWPREAAGAVLRRYREVMATAPDELTAYAALVTTPEGQPVVAVIPCWCGDPATGERVLARLRGVGAPVMDAVAPTPFPQMQRLLDGAFPDGTRNYWKSAFVRELSDAAIDLVVAQAAGARSPLTAVVVEYYGGGAAGRVGVGDTAFAARQAEYDVGFMAQWANPADDAAEIGWARGAWEALSAHASGAYLANFLPEEADDVVRAAYGANYPRLAALKRRYDPQNFFSLNLNIAAAA